MRLTLCMMFCLTLQVQVKTNIPTKSTGIPFILLLKDPMAHIESLNENPKYATKVTTTMNNRNDYGCFNVVVPEQEQYYSLLKYRCRNELRPVPIVSVTYVSL
jgi:hypothetical protein